MKKKFYLNAFAFALSTIFVGHASYAMDQVKIDSVIISVPIKTVTPNRENNSVTLKFRYGQLLDLRKASKRKDTTGVALYDEKEVDKFNVDNCPQLTIDTSKIILHKNWLGIVNGFTLNDVPKKDSDAAELAGCSIADIKTVRKIHSMAWHAMQPDK